MSMCFFPIQTSIYRGSSIARFPLWKSYEKSRMQLSENLTMLKIAPGGVHHRGNCLIFHRFPTVFLWFSYGFPMVFHGFPMVFHRFPSFSHGFPMVFLCFPWLFSHLPSCQTPVSVPDRSFEVRRARAFTAWRAPPVPPRKPRPWPPPGSEGNGQHGKTYGG